MAMTLMLAACGAPRASDMPDPQRSGSAALLGDPAVAAAIAAPIMVDPGLAQMANADTIRPPTLPDPVAVPADALGLAAAMPATGVRAAPAPAGDCAGCRAARRALTLAALAELSGTGAACTAGIGYASGWALDLPAAIQPPPDARIVESAGNDAPGCRLRAASLLSPSPVQHVLDWFHTRAAAAGFATQHRADTDDHLLTARRGEQSFSVFLSPGDGGGTDIRLVAAGS